MKWESLNLYIENLIPGTLIIVLGFMLLPESTSDSLKSNIPPEILANDFFASTCFLAAAYTAGVLCVAISRAIFDRLSEWFVRPLLIRRFSRDQYKNQTLSQVNEDYRSIISLILNSAKQPFIDEVLKRRQSGRLVRTSLVPAILFIFVVIPNIQLSLEIFLSLVVLIVILCTYAYIEFTIWEECQLALKSSSSDSEVSTEEIVLKQPKADILMEQTMNPPNN